VAPSSGPAPTSAAAQQPISGGPTLLRDDIALRQVGNAGAGSIRLAVHPESGEVYVLLTGGGLKRINLESGAMSDVASVQDLVGDGVPSGMAFGPDGTLYVVANKSDGKRNTGIIRRGTPEEGWSTLAETEPYPISGTNFDHIFNGVVASPDGAWVYVNSGSRTDHGEVQDNEGSFPDLREGALTSRIFRLPADGSAITLADDEEATKQYVFAKGTRNAYDLAFAPNGDLFGVDNGPDSDFADELNWLQEGRHYGFPWRFGADDNPQQFPDYDPSADKRLSPDFVAVQRSTYTNDPDYPQPPQEFTNPVANSGPAAAVYRDEAGAEQDAAANGSPLYTFTPHRSPLGLVFADDEAMPADLRGAEATPSALVLSWGAAGGDLSDQGQDLLHLALTKDGENYSAVTTQVARDFKHPIDAVLIGNRLYVLEFDGQCTIWELTFG
jgi:hypothetical protein